MENNNSAAKFVVDKVLLWLILVPLGLYLLYVLANGGF